MNNFYTFIGNFLLNFNLLKIIKNYYFFDKYNFYKNRQIFFDKFFFNKKIILFFLCLYYIKFGNLYIYLYMLYNFNRYIKLIYEINFKNKLEKLIFKKDINFFLSEINKSNSYKIFTICCILSRKLIKNYGISLRRKLAEKNSYKSLLNTILM